MKGYILKIKAGVILFPTETLSIQLQGLFLFLQTINQHFIKLQVEFYVLSASDS